MSAVVNALRDAGVKVPTVKYRIWNWLRDHAEKTSDDVQKALGLAYPPSQSLVDMERDGVLKAYSDVSRKKGLKGVEYRIKRYSVVNKAEYVEPVRKVHKKKPAPAECFVNTPSHYKERVRIKVAPDPLPTFALREMLDKASIAPRKPITMVIKRHPVNLDDLTIKQARALYDDLKELFQ